MESSQKKFGKYTIFYISCCVSFAILVVTVFTLPVGFSEFRSSDNFAPFWFLITTTGAFYGGAVIIIFLTFYLLIHFRKKKNFKKEILIFIGSVLLIQLLLTGLTSFLFKNYFQNPRPSQLYFVQKGFIENEGKEFFDLPLEEKSKFLRNKIENNQDSFKDIYPPILDSWVYESGFSFPSGHSLTSFFLGIILSFIIYNIHPKKFYFLLPLVWAICVALSRVLIGVHFPVDVTVGALLGLVSALWVISNKKINRLFV